MSKNRLKELRTKRGKKLTQEEVAARVSEAGIAMSEAYYSLLERGERRLNEDHINAFAKVFAVEPYEILTTPAHGTTNGLQRISVIGAVQAGVWREALEWDTDDSFSIGVHFDDPDMAAHCYGLKVEGDSMNLCYPEGVILIVLPLEFYPKKLRTGKRVVVQRERGGTIEATVKELVIKDGKAELWPRSTNSRFQQPVDIHWPYQDPQTSGIEKVSICGVVIGSYNREEEF